MKFWRVVLYAVKWLVVPALMAAMGYFLIGPRVGGAPTETKPAQAAPPTITSVAEPETKQFGEPQLEVTGKPATKRSGTSTKRRKTAGSKPAPSRSGGQDSVPGDAGAGNA